MVDLVCPWFLIEPSHVDFIVKVANVAHDGLVLHRLEVAVDNNVLVAGGGDDDARHAYYVVHAANFKPVHHSLKGTNGVDFGHDDTRARRLE